MDFVSRGFVDDLAGNERRAGPDFLLLATSDRESNVGINKNQKYISELEKIYIYT